MAVSKGALREKFEQAQQILENHDSNDSHAPRRNVVFLPESHLLRKTDEGELVDWERHVPNSKKKGELEHHIDLLEERMSTYFNYPHIKFSFFLNENKLIHTQIFSSLCQLFSKLVKMGKNSIQVEKVSYEAYANKGYFEIVSNDFKPSVERLINNLKRAVSQMYGSYEQNPIEIKKIFSEGMSEIIIIVNWHILPEFRPHANLQGDVNKKTQVSGSD